MSCISNLKVLVTRPEKQAEKLCALLNKIGMIPVKLPVLEIVASEEEVKIREILSQLHYYQWLFFVSVNAVNFTLRANNGKIPKLQGVGVIAIGQATASALRNVGINVDLMPERGFNSEAVLALPELQQLSGKSCLIVRGKGGRELLPETLKKRGAKVDSLEVYQRVQPKVDVNHVENLLDNNELDVITITSVEALINLLKIFGSNKQLLFSIPLVVISERIGKVAKQLGFTQIVISEQPSDTALVKAILNGGGSVRSN